jgi:uncharacterized protein YndB with AHSA1/START domain
MATPEVRKMRHRILLSAIALCVTAETSSAEVVNVAPNGFSVKHAMTIQASPENVYAALTGKVGSWWNPEHTYSHDSRNLSIGARPGDCFCEKLGNDGGVEHMRVVLAWPGQMLRMTGALGPLQGSGLAGSMTWKLTAATGATGTVGATSLEFSYSAGGYMQGGFEKIAPAVDVVLGEQLTRLKAFVETGKPATK